MSAGGEPRVPATLFARLSGLILLTLLATQIVGGILFFIVTPPPPAVVAHVSEIAARLRTARAGDPVRTAVPDVREAARLTRLEPILARYLDAPAGAVRIAAAGPPLPMLRERDATGIDPVVLGGYRASWRVDDGWVTVMGRVHGPQEIARRMLTWLAVTLLCIAPVSTFLAWRATAPVTVFARAAARLGRAPYVAPMSASGPAELVVAVGAFNEMQQRLRVFIDDRVRMMGAIAHDLRTPLTRLRLQVQSLPTPRRLRAEGEIIQMEAMIAGALEFVRAATPSTARTPLHLLSLVQVMAEDMDPSRRRVTVAEGPDPVVLADETAVRRLIANLVGNALRYAGACRCGVAVDGDEAVLTVDDDGPGLPDAELETVFDPYVRGRGEDDRNPGGIGLGLSIVRSVAVVHGGSAALSRRAPSGLRAEVRLPLWPERRSGR